MQFHGGTHDEQLGTYVGLRKNRAENQSDYACCESHRSAGYTHTTRVPDPMLEEPTAEKLDKREMSTNCDTTKGVGLPESERQFTFRQVPKSDSERRIPDRKMGGDHTCGSA